MTQWTDGVLTEDVRDVDLTVLEVGPNRLAVAKVLRSAGWSYQGVRDILSGGFNWIKASGLESAHKLAAAGMTLRVDDRTYRVPFPSYYDDPSTFGDHPEWQIAWTRRVFGPGHTQSLREHVRRWAKEFM